jgi:hypothetical protein
MDVKIDISQDTKMYVSETAPQVLAIGASRHQLYRVVGFGPVPESEFVMGLWRVVPHSVPPSIAKKRIDLVYAYGIQINGYVVIHEPSIREAPKPPAQPRPESDFKVNPIISNTESSAVVGTAAIGLAAVAAVAFAVIFQAILSDPSYIIVCGPENVWIEVLNDYDA